MQPVNEWRSLRHAADVGASAGQVSVDHSSLSNHMKALDYAIMKRIFEVIIGKSLEDPRFILVCDRAYFSIEKVHQI